MMGRSVPSIAQMDPAMLVVAEFRADHVLACRLIGADLVLAGG